MSEQDEPTFPDTEKLRREVFEIAQYVERKEMIELRKQNANLFDSNAGEKFFEFSEKYPAVFDLILTNGGDIGGFYSMLDQIEKVKSGAATFKQVEAELTDTLAERYIYPNLSKEEKEKVKSFVEKELDGS